MSREHDPEWVELEKAMGNPGLPEDPLELRAAFNAALIGLSKSLPATDPGIKTRDEQISSEVKVRVYHPPGADDKKPPLIVYCHGGGWQAGNLDTEDHLCRTVCAQATGIVVSVEYRLFPEVGYQTMIDDCFEGYQWAYDHAENLGADPTRYAIWGGSAGAGVAMAVAYKLLSSGQSDRISGVVAMAGTMVHPDVVPAKYQHLHKSYVENSGDVPVVTGEKMLAAYEMIIGRSGTTDINWFPLAGAPETLKAFPRTYIINTDREACRDDGLVLEAALRDSNVPVRRDNLPALPHYFWCFPVEKAGARFRSTLVEGIRWVLSSE